MVRLTVAALLERKVPQVLGVYLAGSWALLEFTSWAADRGHAPFGAADVLFWLLIALAPVAVLAAWRLGGPSRPAAPERRVAREAAPESVRASLAPRSVAVLPLENLSVDPDDAYLGDAISDELITALARIEGLRVASRTSSFLYGTERRDARDIGERLGVQAVLEGSLQRAGNRLRVSTRLAGTGDGFELWSRRWDADMSDLFRIEDEITTGVVDALRVILRDGPVRRESGNPPNVRAYEHYLRGRQFFYQVRRKSLRYAREMFERAVEADPAFALAHAAIADSISLERLYYPSDVDLGRAEEASLTALALAPQLAEVHSSRGLVLFVRRDYASAEAEFLEAIRIDRRLFDAHYFLARMYFQQGRLEEAARSFDGAAALREEPEAHFFAAQAYEAMGRTEESGQRYRRAVTLAETHMALNPDDARAATIRAVALCRTGREAEGLEWGARAVEIDPGDAGVRYNVACLYAVAGRSEEAIRQLEGAVAVGFGNLDWIRRDPDLSSIRDDPRVKAILNSA